MEMYRRTYAEINLNHLAYNIRAIQKAFPEAGFLCPMVKANAYGHGDARLGLYLESIGIRQMGVCLLEEGITLRKAGVNAEILIFRGFDFEGAQKIAEYSMTPVVSSWEHIEHLEALDSNSPTNIHLKFDTGMNRLGFRPEEGQKLFDRLWQNKKIRLKALATHLFNGEDATDENGKTAMQLKALNQLAQIFKPFNIFCHALNSSAIISAMSLQKSKPGSQHPLMLQNWGLRPGLMIYGYNPLADKSIVDLKPVMTLKAQVNAYRHVKTGETVSYGGTWKAKRDSVIAVISIGYGDGYHRILSNKSQVLFAGKRVPVVGTVCMDYLMLDVTDIVQGKDLKEFKDQEAVLFGQDHGAYLPAEELATQAQSITWEMLTSVGERVPRVYVGGGQ